MTRRKGERPLARPLENWSAQHPVARAIATGSRWFDAWIGQQSTPLVRLARQTGISAARLMTIQSGDRISRAEIDALARAWRVSAGDLIASMPDSALVVE